ncbi:hypothetical protein EXE30_06740 [Acinetobacter halotolerans]|uniref:Uncharacterized protein n=1 Tax=Acinetobacter halotolerans TaxID=1752076 RepID=A0A4Q6XA01_9GAMM|nr:hypothetical protein [Acinetobacter halotolerans]RZF53666.1 hypothetical protein EXE30_06740 [Acinetobacter halotolerans]
MKVQVRVTDINRQKMQFTVEAIDGSNLILKRSFQFKTESKKHIESVINKELKTFNKPSYGGIEIVFMCRLGVLS